jgi:hypothetical protein
MPYEIQGDFIEACDCSLICPCWLDDEPEDGHCTGLFAWRIGPGSVIGGVPVGGRIVVSVSTHTGSRRGGGTLTAIFVDAGATDLQLEQLGRAFAGELDGPLAGLAAVSGLVVQRERANIQIVSGPAQPEAWTVTVSQPSPRGDVPLVTASGEPKRFEQEVAPLTLDHTALDQELGAGGAVTAQQAGTFSVHVAALPGGYLDITGRSAMRGAFRYEHASDQAGGSA